MVLVINCLLLKILIKYGKSCWSFSQYGFSPNWVKHSLCVVLHRFIICTFQACSAIRWNQLPPLLPIVSCYNLSGYPGDFPNKYVKKAPDVVDRNIGRPPPVKRNKPGHKRRALIHELNQERWARYPEPNQDDIDDRLFTTPNHLTIDAGIVIIVKLYQP